MLSIGKSAIPQYLQNGELYRTLMENNDDPDEEVTFPGNVLKLNSSVRSTEDCDRLLDSLRFWGVGDFISKDLIKYVLRNPSREKIIILQKYESDFKFVRVLREVIEAPEKHCDVAAKGGIVEIMSFLLAHLAPWSVQTAGIAALHGHVSILQLMHKSGYRFGFVDMRHAVVGGHLECVKYLLACASSILDGKGDIILELCAEYGHAHILRYLFDLGMQCHRHICYIAAKNGKLNCLQLAHERNAHWDDFTCEAAAQAGHVDCLQYAHEHGCPWWKDTCALVAASNGHLECLRYMHEQGCPWHPDTCAYVAQNGHLHCLKYAHEHGCPWNEGTCAAAALQGTLDCVKYLHEHGCPWNQQTCAKAASAGNLSCLQYLYEHGCPWDEQTCRVAAQHGQLECLKYAHERGCPFKFPINIDESNVCYKYGQKHGTRLFKSCMN